ncbi:MAG: 1-acyl-sn-glycerol-3-phosphate acyltransferase [Clostridia bacterium]|nr:1-acyl-sn-glycerol-3-phosphate acyltransferase [Clostridia bacterium]
MKIKTTNADYESVLAMPEEAHKKPVKPNLLFRTVIRLASIPDLIATKFTYNEIGMDKLKKDEPCLILMNHSSFIDLKIASKVLYPRAYNIVSTSDGLVGRNWLMRNIGCIPTAKFVTDLGLVRDMIYTVKKLKCSILMYPEASYSFDGTATTLPDSLGECVKSLKIPLIIIRTYGAFARDPLYNNLQLRKTKVSADVEYALSPEDIKKMSSDEINSVIRERFSFDNFRWQQENKVKITEKFRADHLNRVLYKCPNCLAEGKTEGKGIHLTCHNCGKSYELTEDGFMKADSGETEFNHIPDWYKWERECVKNEIESGEYKLDIPVDIRILVNSKSIYNIGEGRLVHTSEGFHLTGCDGKLDYRQKPLASYSLYSDYYWYELGDMICIGDTNALYYCFPKVEGDFVAKTRLAAEELYKIKKAQQ